MLIGIGLRELQRIRGRIDDANIHTARLVFQRAAPGTRDPHHVPEGGEDDIRLLSDGETVVDSAHGEHANRATWPVNELDIGWQQILQAKAINSVSVSSAHFHDAIVTVSISQPTDFRGSPGNHLGFAKFIDKLHDCSNPYP